MRFWFEEDFKKESNPYFIKAFIYLMENTKNQEINIYEFLKTIEPYHGKEHMYEEVLLFERSVVQKMKRICQLPELQTHLLQIKDIKKPVRVTYLEELSTRLQQLKPPLKKL